MLNYRVHLALCWLLIFPLAVTAAGIKGSDASFLPKSATPKTAAPKSAPPDVAHCPGVPVFSEVFAALHENLPGDLWTRPLYLKQLVEEIEAVAADGLNPEDYYLSRLASIERAFTSRGSVPVCDSRLAGHAYLKALAHLRFGRLDALKARLFWYENPPWMGEKQEVLARIARTGFANIGAAFDAARPDLPRYRGLREAHQRALKEMPTDWVRVPAGTLWKEGSRDEGLVLLRERLRSEGYLPSPGNGGIGNRAGTGDGSGPDQSVVDESLFDGDLTQAVKRFQTRHGLASDGVAGPKTLAELNVTPAQRLERIRMNLERMRWLASDMEPETLLVDIAGARIEYFRQGQLIWADRAQVGTAKRVTPTLKSRITHVTLNPSWTVPPTIYKKDKLPEIRKDISYLAKNRIRVLDREGRELDPAGIDWRNPGNIVLRQDPGAKSALGLVALRFPNPFAVYLHDTPNQGLFDTHDRFYSSGCVRVRNAMGLTELLFDRSGPEEKEAFQQILASGKTRHVDLPVPVALVMAYWTAEANGEGEIVYRPDVYGLDNALDDPLGP